MIKKIRGYKLDVREGELWKKRKRRVDLKDWWYREFENEIAAWVVWDRYFGGSKVRVEEVRLEKVGGVEYMVRKWIEGKETAIGKLELGIVLDGVLFDGVIGNRDRYGSCNILSRGSEVYLIDHEKAFVDGLVASGRFKGFVSSSRIIGQKLSIRHAQLLDRIREDYHWQQVMLIDLIGRVAVTEMRYRVELMLLNDRYLKGVELNEIYKYG